jgi:hypothetical protein
LADVEFDSGDYAACAATSLSLLCSVGACVAQGDVNVHQSIDADRHCRRLLQIGNTNLTSPLNVTILSLVLVFNIDSQICRFRS